MLLWAGNNENELGLHDGWFSGATMGFVKEQSKINRELTEIKKTEYLRLYKDTAEVVISQLDPGRPFVMSSPSEGVKSIE